MANPNIPPGPGRPKGSKNKTTLDKEQRRILFEELVSNRFKQLVAKARAEYLLDQFLGKAPETFKHQIEFLFDEDKVENVVAKVGKLPAEAAGSGKGNE